MKHALAIALIMTVSLLGGIIIGYELDQPTTEYVEVPVEIETIREVKTLEVQVQYIEVPTPIHNEPRLYEFTSKKELGDYIRWYRNEVMPTYKADQCVDAAIDFMKQAIADGYLVSTETVYQEYESKLFPSTYHMMNTTVIGEDVWAIDITSGSKKLFGRKGI